MIASGTDVGHHDIRHARRHRVHGADEAEAARSRPRSDRYRRRYARSAPSRVAACARMPEPVPTSSTRMPGPQIVFQRFHAQPRRLVDAGAERHPGIHGDAEAARRRRIVAPFGDEEEALADLHGLQQVARRLHPVALLLLAHGATRDRAPAAPSDRLRRTRARGCGDSSAMPAEPCSHNSAMSRSRSSGSHSISRENMCYRGIFRRTMKLQGIFPPITTPFDHAGNIYVSQSAAQRREVEPARRFPATS